MREGDDDYSFFELQKKISFLSKIGVIYIMLFCYIICLLLYILFQSSPQLQCTNKFRFKTRNYASY